MESNLEVITNITYLFFVYLIMALFVERLIEVAVSAFNYFDQKFRGHTFWNRKAEQYRERFDRLYGFHAGRAPHVERLLNWLLWKVLSEKPYPGGKEIVSADLIRMNYVRVGARILAFLVSVGFAWWAKVALDIDLVTVVEKLLPDVRFVDVLARSKFLQILITAAAISVGTEPLHEAISRIEELSKSRNRRTRPAGQGGAG